MRKIRRVVAIVAFFLTATLAVHAQDPLSYLRTQCPKLTEMYQDELKNCHAHYVIAVDVDFNVSAFQSFF